MTSSFVSVLSGRNFNGQTLMLELWVEKCETHGFPGQMNYLPSEPETINETGSYGLKSALKHYPTTDK